MKKLLLFVFCLWSLAAYAQVGSQSVSGIKFRVNDTTTYQAAAVSAHTAGYADIYWNNQATTKHFDAWNGSSYTHIFDFTGGSGIDGHPAMTSYPSSHTLTLADYNSFNNQGITRWTISGPANLTVPLDATVDFNDGAQIGIDNQGSDTLTVVFTGGVTGNTGGYVEIFPGGSALLLKISTNLWDLLGTQPGGGGGSGTVESVSGTTNRITSTGGTDPVIDISSSYVGQASITTIGTISTGTVPGTLVSNTPAGGIAATTAQAAINELDTEKIGTTNFVFSEVPSGTVNGTNAAFTLANTPTSGTVMLYLNGVRQKGGGVDYSISGTTITFTTAPDTGGILLVDYMK